MDTKDLAVFIEKNIGGNTLRRIYTPNPEILLCGLRDNEYGSMLCNADVSLPDGQGLRQVASFLHRTHDTKRAFLILWQWILGYVFSLFIPSKMDFPIPKVIAGSTTFMDLHEYFSEDIRVFYFGGEMDVPERLLEFMKKQYPKVNIVGSCGGYPYRSKEEATQVFKNIKGSGANMLFVALPFPLQEKFTWEFQKELEDAGIRVCMVVGGSFDFAVGDIKRAPQILQYIRMEWLWRLVQQPRRIGRICNAVFVFPYKMLLRRLEGKDDLILPS